MDENEVIELSSNGATLIGQDGIDAETPAAVSVVDIELFELVGDWGRGDPAGTLHATCTTLPNGKALWHLMFDLDGKRFGKGTIVATGVLPILPDGPGAGRAAVTGWAGDPGRRRSVTIDVQNPKRYRIEA